MNYDKINTQILENCLKLNKLENLLSGKERTKLPLPNGDIQNLYPQDYLGVVRLIYSSFIDKKYENLDYLFEEALLNISLGDKVELFAAINIILVQLDYEKQNKAPFKLKRTKEILNNIKNNISTKNESIKSETIMWNDIQYVNKWLIDNQNTEIISYSK